MFLIDILLNRPEHYKKSLYLLCIYLFLYLYNIALSAYVCGAPSLLEQPYRPDQCGLVFIHIVYNKSGLYISATFFADNVCGGCCKNDNFH